MAKKGRILTGDRPTGKLHLGHYVGSLENRVRLQDEYDCFFIVADYHALTTRFENPHDIGDNIRDQVLDYLSVGMDPNKSTFYLQSLVPETCELHLLFSMLISVPRLQRLPTLKDLVRDLQLETASYGLLGYPVLQAADILIVRGELVPVGKDQASHLEITREIARRFNELYGETLPIPETLIGDVPTLVGLDGKAKMSKSLNNTILLSDSPEEVRKKVMSMYTDPTRLRATDPGHVEGNPVFQYHDAFNPNTAEVDDLKERYRAGNVGDVEVKRKLIAALEGFLEPIRERRAAAEATPGLVDEIIVEGSRRARHEAEITIRMVREAMGLTYFMADRPDMAASTPNAGSGRS
ncbi:MAG: tryptophan--tRNA ligase [Chloroflexi bacterium]|nr:tryptophan--tRNA ligase [Chloroflexota bacterium]